jgi:hypothetical protein
MKFMKEFFSLFSFMSFTSFMTFMCDFGCRRRVEVVGPIYCPPVFAGSSGFVRSGRGSPQR